MPALSEKVTHAPDFFVVGGPVAADKACYIRRRADDDLLAAIAAQRFAYVLAPRAMGKSSLMGRAVRRLRADGQLAAVVDLTQIGSRGEQIDSARWHYSIAYRICRELRLKVDLQSWWQDRNLLVNEQRLVEFFWDIVLANTSDSVTVFFDEAGRAVDLPYLAELFAALNACYSRRVSEPEYARLNFVVLGVATPGLLCPDPAVSPFVDGKNIRLEDFSLAECAGFAPGFAESAGVEKQLARIHFWTRGQPYMTQKLARAVVRRGGRLGDVDPALHETFLAPGVAREEPLLNHMRGMIAAGTPRGRQAATILARLSKGGEAIYDPASAAQRLLLLAGFVSSDDNGMLRFRNRIVEQIFGAENLRRSESARWRRPAAFAAAALAAVVLLPYWYTQILPRSDIETLRFSSDYALAEAAYRRLGRLPGLGRRADNLLADAMSRKSRNATSYADVQAADAVIRRLPDHGELADDLLAAYWLRQAELAALRGERDNALVNAIAAIDEGSDAAAVMASNLIGGDYESLERTFSLTLPPVAAAVDWERGQLAVIDQAYAVERLMLDGDSPGAGRSAAADIRGSGSRLTALQHVGVTRGIFVDEPGNAGTFRLRLTVDHERASDLLVRLRAPSGAAVDVPVPEREGGLEEFVWTASARNGLLRLAGESITGQWELTLFDRLSGATGRLVNWELRFPGVPRPWDDAPVEGIELPDPVRTEQVAVVLATDGRVAAAIPTRADARGAVSIWDTSAAERLFDIPLADRVDDLQLVGSEHLLVLGRRQAALWHFGDDDPVVDFVSAGGFSRAPITSADGSSFALVESAGASDRVSVLRVADGSVLSRFDTEPWVDAWLAADAAWLAVVNGTRRGRVIDALTGSVLADFFHDRELEHVMATPDGSRIVAVDRSGEIYSWPYTAGVATLSPGDGVLIGKTRDYASVAVAADSVAFVDGDGLVQVVQSATGQRRAALEHSGAGASTLRLDPSADRLVSFSEERIRFWKIPQVRYPVHGGGDVSAVMMNDEARFAVLGFRGGEVRMLDGLADPGEIHTVIPGDVAAHRGVVTSLAINAQGTQAASGGSDGLVRIWDTRTGDRSLLLLRHSSGPIVALAFSPDNRWIVSAGPGSVRIFDLTNGDQRNEIEVDGLPASLAISSDSRQIAIGDGSGNIILTAPDPDAGVLAIRGRSPITALRFVDDSTLLASGSSDGDLVLWDALSAAAVEGVHRFPAEIRWIEAAGDGAAIYLQSGSWLYQLDRTGEAARVGSPVLLPSTLRGRPALARPEGRGTLGLADEGAGRLRLVPVDSPGGEMAGRDWQTVLGMAADPATGTVRSLP